MNHDPGGTGERPQAGRVAHGARYQLLNMPALPERLRGVRDDLRRWAADAGLTDDQIDTVVLCADEAMANAVEHAYSHTAGTLDITALRIDSPSEIRVTVTDRGRWQEPAADAGYRGRGLMIIRKLAHHVELESGPLGTTVEMIWNRNP